MKMYHELKQEIEQAPITWLGGLLQAVIFQCLKKKFFKSTDELIKFMTKQAIVLDSETWMLRDDKKEK